VSQREAWDRWHATHQVESTSPTALMGLHGIVHRLHGNTVFLDVGVGVGEMARFLSGLGVTVDCVDISPVAGEQVARVARRFYLADEIEEIGTETYDLALSHLVAQHTEDPDFIRQTKHVYRALARGGTYSIQFAGSDLGEASRVAPSATEVGHVVRTPVEAVALCGKACPGAEVGLLRAPERWASTNTGDHTYYFYIHVTKPR
jgi:SAM-dependent methyltransferase